MFTKIQFKGDCVLTIDSKSKQFIFDEEGVAIITPN